MTLKKSLKILMVILAFIVFLPACKSIEEPREEILPEVRKKISYDKYVMDYNLYEYRRKKETGEFYVHLRDLDDVSMIERIEAKGLYISSAIVGFSINRENVEIYAQYINKLKNNKVITNDTKKSINKINRLERAIAIAIATEINTFVIDVKDDDGLLNYDSNIEIVNNINSDRYSRIKDIRVFMDVLEEYDIYPIARIVTFKDRMFAKSNPNHAIRDNSNNIWKDKYGISWVNPFDEYVWKYNIAIAQEAALLGFKEIQFDYVRFPVDAFESKTTYPDRNERSRDDGIKEFLTYAKEELKDYSVIVSADVFGVVTRYKNDRENIGQTWTKISDVTDVISPMIYPSHYGPYWYGCPVPDAQPYKVLNSALTESIKQNTNIDNPANIRPWIQGFTASWVKGHIKYGYEEIIEQIDAGYDLNIMEYLVWNAGCYYDPRAFIR